MPIQVDPDGLFFSQNIQCPDAYVRKGKCVNEFETHFPIYAAICQVIHNPAERRDFGSLIRIDRNSQDIVLSPTDRIGAITRKRRITTFVFPDACTVQVNACISHDTFEMEERMFSLPCRIEPDMFPVPADKLRKGLVEMAERQFEIGVRQTDGFKVIIVEIRLNQVIREARRVFPIIIQVLDEAHDSYRAFRGSHAGNMRENECQETRSVTFSARIASYVFSSSGYRLTRRMPARNTTAGMGPMMRRMVNSVAGFWTASGI